MAITYNGVVIPASTTINLDGSATLTYGTDITPTTPTIGQAVYVMGWFRTDVALVTTPVFTSDPERASADYFCDTYAGYNVYRNVILGGGGGDDPLLENFLYDCGMLYPVLAGDTLTFTPGGGVKFTELYAIAVWASNINVKQAFFPVSGYFPFAPAQFNSNGGAAATDDCDGSRSPFSGFDTVTLGVYTDYFAVGWALAGDLMFPADCDGNDGNVAPTTPPGSWSMDAAIDDVTYATGYPFHGPMTVYKNHAYAILSGSPASWDAYAQWQCLGHITCDGLDFFKFYYLLMLTGMVYATGPGPSACPVTETPAGIFASPAGTSVSTGNPAGTFTPDMVGLNHIHHRTAGVGS